MTGKGKKDSINNLVEPNIAIFFLSVSQPTNRYCMPGCRLIACARRRGKEREVRKVDGEYLRR